MTKAYGRGSNEGGIISACKLEDMLDSKDPSIYRPGLTPSKRTKSHFGGFYEQA